MNICINKKVDKKYPTYGEPSDFTVLERLSKFNDVVDIFIDYPNGQEPQFNIANVMMNNEFNISDEDSAKLTYRIANENGGKVPVEEIAEKVFECFAAYGDFKEIDDITYYARKFIYEH